MITVIVKNKYNKILFEMEVNKYKIIDNLRALIYMYINCQFKAEIYSKHILRKVIDL